MTPQSGNQVSTSLGNSGLCWTVFARNRDTAVPAEGNGDYQTLICVLVARPRRCSTLTNPVPWQNWMAAYLGYTLRMRTLFRGWPIMVNDTHTRRRRSNLSGCAKALCPFHSNTKVLSPAIELRYFFITCNVNYLLPVIRRKCLFCLHNCRILWFLSIIVIVCAGVESTNVVCPHNGTYDICIFVISRKEVLWT